MTRIPSPPTDPVAPAAEGPRRRGAPGIGRRAWLGWLGAAALPAISSGCASLEPGAPAARAAGFEEPRYQAPPEGQRSRVALVLSGGSARGFAHLGVLRVLEREKLRPDLVVGSSAGAIVGAMWASGMSVTDIERAGGELDWSVLFDIDPLRTLLGGFGLGVVAGRRLERFLRAKLPRSMQSFPIRFAAVAADMATGDVVPLNHGDAALALRASTAVPGVYEPVRAGGRLLADGQIVSPLPVAAARRLGALRVLASDVVYPPQHSSLTNPVSMLFQSLIVSGWRHVLAERALADLVIAPEIRTTGQIGLEARRWVADAGERAARARVAELRELFASSASTG